MGIGKTGMSPQLAQRAVLINDVPYSMDEARMLYEQLGELVKPETPALKVRTITLEEQRMLEEQVTPAKYNIADMIDMGGYEETEPPYFAVDVEQVSDLVDGADIDQSLMAEISQEVDLPKIFEQYSLGNEGRAKILLAIGVAKVIRSSIGRLAAVRLKEKMKGNS